MFGELDHGIRCDRHTGEVFPPRCDACQREARERDEETAPLRFARYVPGSECQLHPGYPQPCDSCARQQVAA